MGGGSNLQYAAGCLCWALETTFNEDDHWFMLISHMAVCLFFHRFRAVLLIPKHSPCSSRNPNCLSYLLYTEAKYSGSNIIDLAYIMAVAPLCSNPLFKLRPPNFPQKLTFSCAALVCTSTLSLCLTGSLEVSTE